MLAAASAASASGLQATWHDHPAQVPSQAWDALLAGVDGGSPFLRHAMLCALVDSQSACAETGWLPHILTLHDAGGQLVGACPTFLKSHSYGEYVFDWAWADAHDRALARHGLSYYPKLLGAVPFSPIPGARLLVHPALGPSEQEGIRHALLSAIEAECGRHGWSSAHLLFVSDEEARSAEAGGWLRREGVQFHWHNRQPRPYADFDDFLSSLQRDKRKKIQQERRKVREAGIAFEVKVGRDISPADWDLFHRCYTQTYLEHGQRPYLSRAFWEQVSQHLPDAWALFIARQGEQAVACSLLAIDPVGKVAHGRYWGALAAVSCLHFEACYYQPLAWCIEQGMRRFEGGAQGEHKLSRGLMPVSTRSVHWLRHEGLREAVADFLQRERQGVCHHVNELLERRPFKPSTDGEGTGETMSG